MEANQFFLKAFAASFHRNPTKCLLDPHLLFCSDTIHPNKYKRQCAKLLLNMSRVYRCFKSRNSSFYSSRSWLCVCYWLICKCCVELEVHHTRSWCTFSPHLDISYLLPEKWKQIYEFIWCILGNERWNSRNDGINKWVKYRKDEEQVACKCTTMTIPTLVYSIRM